MPDTNPKTPAQGKPQLQDTAARETEKSDNLATLAPSGQPSTSQSSELPESFGRYRILKLLGQGGMGSVFLAQDTQLERQVALKVPKFEASDGPQVLGRRVPCNAVHYSGVNVRPAGVIQDGDYVVFCISCPDGPMPGTLEAVARCAGRTVALDSDPLADRCSRSTPEGSGRGEAAVCVFGRRGHRHRGLLKRRSGGGPCACLLDRAKRQGRRCPTWC